ncbi:MAG: hypothetical protein OXI94_02850 [Gemmatimonadota bacterium]|nr:hypothetical protein [Gemmatimonadota bacterium]
MQTIKNFIYLDEYKMYSISSQIFEGITEYLIDYQETKREEEEKQKGLIGSGKIMADILKSESGTEEKKYLHDYSYKLFEDHLQESNKILSISVENIDAEIESIDNAAFVKVRAKAVFNDMNIIKSTMGNFNELGEALAYISTISEREEAQQLLETVAENIKDRNQRSQLRQRQKALTDIKKLAKEQGLYLDPKLLKNLVLVLDYGFQDQFEVQMPIKPYTFSANIKREYLRENEHLLIRKYSRLAEKEFVLVGTIAQSSSKSLMNEEPDEGHEYQHLKEALMSMVERLSEVESTFTGKLENEFIIDPIALYREI